MRLASVSRAILSLETFLSGMETGKGGLPVGYCTKP